MLRGLCLALALAASAAEPQVVHPETTDDKLSNPHMGFIYYGGTLHPDIADVYFTTGLTWGELEPREGQYVWDLNAPPWAAVRAALDRGKRVAIRIMPSFQDHPYATPKWVHDLGVKRFPATKIQQQHGQRDLYEPEWWNPVYIEKYCNFVRALGREFDGRPWLDWLDMRYYGYWGEGHRFYAEVPWPENVSKRDTLIRFIDAHLDAFHKTPLVVQMANDEATPYPEGTAIDYALDRGCWMRRDGFGPYINDQEAALMKAQWRSSVMIAENGGSYVDFAAGKIRKSWVADSKPISLEECLDQMLEFHCNYIPLGWGDADWRVLEQRPDLLKKLWMKMGYRLVVDEVTLPRRARPGETVQISHRWRNVGVGRLPKPYPLTWYLVPDDGKPRRVLLDETFNETAWFEGEPHSFTHELTLPRDLAPGTYGLALALVSPESGEPTIALGITGDRGDRIYRIAGLVVDAIDAG